MTPLALLLLALWLRAEGRRRSEVARAVAAERALDGLVRLTRETTIPLALSRTDAAELAALRARSEQMRANVERLAQATHVAVQAVADYTANAAYRLGEDQHPQVREIGRRIDRVLEEVEHGRNRD